MTTAKIEKTERKRRARARIIESMSAGKKIKIRERKTDLTIDTRMNEGIEGRKRNDGIEIRRIREEITAKTDQKGEIGGMRPTTGEGITAKRDWNEGVRGTSIAIENVDIVIAREKGMKKMILGINRTSIKENGEGKNEMMMMKFQELNIPKIYIYHYCE